MRPLSNSIIPYLLMPLAVLGLGVLKDLGKGISYQPWRFGGLAVLLVIYGG